MTEDHFLRQVQVSVIWATYRQWLRGAETAAPGSNGYALWVVRTGSVEVEIGESRWYLTDGDALLLPSNIHRDRIATPSGAAWLSLGLTAQLFGRLDVLPVLAPPRQWRPDAETWARLLLWTEQIVQYWTEDDTSGTPLIRSSRARDTVAQIVGDGLGKAIFGLVWKSLRDLGGGTHAPLTTALPGAPDWFLEVLRRIQLEPSIGAAELCRAVHISPTHLRRAFHRFLNQSPQQYLTERRLEEARRLLETSDIPIVDIAAEVGFESLSHFTRRFKHRYSEPPARYRHLFSRPTV
jgi:AraC-like DNA-binding protein